MTETGILGHDERLELIGGEFVPMAAKGSRHETIKASLNLHWARNCPTEFAFVPETGLRLDPRNYLEPDFIVFRAWHTFSSASPTRVLDRGLQRDDPPRWRPSDIPVYYRDEDPCRPGGSGRHRGQEVA